MFIFITITVLLLTAIGLLGLQLTPPATRYSWVIATVGALAGWVSVFLWQLQIPLALQLPGWEPVNLLKVNPGLLADDLTWVLALSLTGLCLAIMVTAATRPEFPSPLNWVSIAAITAFGLLAITSGNPLTLVLLWAALDLVDLLSQLRLVENPRLNERLVISFATRAIGILLLLWADRIASTSGQVLDFAQSSALPASTGVYMLLAVAFRLGIFPLHLPIGEGVTAQRGLRTALQMNSAAASLVLLARIPVGSISAAPWPGIAMLIGVIGVYAGWMWLRAPSELAGQPYWLVGLGTLAMAAALQGNPASVIAWSAALISVGSALFLFAEHNRWLTRFLLVGAWSLSALPFSLTASGWLAAQPLFLPAVPLMLITQAMLLAGYIRQSQRMLTQTRSEEQPVWARNVYPIGIGLLLIQVIVLGLYGWRGSLQFGNFIPSAIAAGLAFVLLGLTARLRILNPVRAHWVRPANASWLEWGYRTVWQIYRQFARLSNALTHMLEGESGMMWTLLMLALFISFFANRSP